MVDVFVSHSSADSWLAKQLVDLLRSSLDLRSEQIRCTSVDGYRLPAGADVDEQLRKEVLASRAFVSILSPSSLESVYVLFEIGARWGTRQPLFPVLAPGMEPRALRGPLSGLNALSCESAGQLHQLVSDMARTLGIAPEPPQVYEGNVETILYSANSQENQSTASQRGRRLDEVGTSRVKSNGGAPTLQEGYSEAERTIREHCEREWPNDYNMRSFCVKQQREALNALKRGRPSDIPEEVFAGIRRKCASDWPEDYNMRRYCEKQQFDSYRELERESG
jgi:hypothetical protein